MVDFQLTEEQLALRQMAREFVKREIKPIVKERERIEDPVKRFPWDIIKKASELGLRTLALPVEYGGGGAGYLTRTITLEELAVGDMGIAITFLLLWKFSPLLVTATTPEQRERFLRPFIEDDTFLICLASTEAESDKGWDYFQPAYPPGSAPRTTARRDGNGDWVINGSKAFISNGGAAKLYLVVARTDPKKTGPTAGVSVFIVPADTPGFSVTRIMDKCGHRLCHNGELFFDNCRVPKGNLLGKEGEGRLIINTMTRRTSWFLDAACPLGVGRAAYEAALDYARERVQGAKPIIQHQAVGMLLADMAISLEAARNLVWKAAWIADHPEIEDVFKSPLPPMAKVFAFEAGFRVAADAMHMMAGVGILRELPMEKYLRDTASFLHSSGTNEMLRLRLAELLAGQAPEI